MSGGQQKHTSYDGSIGWGIMLVIFAVIVWLFWYFFDAEVRNGVRWIRYVEMHIISWFASADYTVPFKGEQVAFFEGMSNTPQWTAEQLQFEHLSYFNALTMQPLKFFMMGILCVCGVIAYLRGPRTQFREKLSLESIIGRHAEIFPIVAPFVKFNPASQPPRPPGSLVPAELPPFAEALGPEEWLAYNSIPVPDGVVDGPAATNHFTKQLGKRWKGPAALAPYKQVLLAAFCLKAARKRIEADEMLGRLALCWSEKKGLNLNKDRKLLKETHRILRNKELCKETMQKINRHAFETTALLRALDVAREEGGVLAPAQFVWLRAHDRNLWYPLNNLGRQSFHMEALGAMTHFKAEKMTDRPIPVPKVEDAVKTISDYMQSKRARPIPQLDYSTAKKKRGVKKAV